MDTVLTAKGHENSKPTVLGYVLNARPMWSVCARRWSSVAPSQRTASTCRRDTTWTWSTSVSRYSSDDSLMPRSSFLTPTARSISENV